MGVSLVFYRSRVCCLRRWHLLQNFPQKLHMHQTLLLWPITTINLVFFSFKVPLQPEKRCFYVTTGSLVTSQTELHNFGYDHTSSCGGKRLCSGRRGGGNSLSWHSRSKSMYIIVCPLKELAKLPLCCLPSCSVGTFVTNKCRRPPATARHILEFKLCYRINLLMVQFAKACLLCDYNSDGFGSSCTLT